MSSVYLTKRGDIGRAFFWQMGSIPDGMATAAVTFTMRDAWSNAMVVDGASAAVANGTYLIDGNEQTYAAQDGVLFYEWQAADLATPRRCIAEFKISVPGSGIIAEPRDGFIDIVIATDLDQ